MSGKKGFKGANKNKVCVKAAFDLINGVEAEAPKPKAARKRKPKASKKD